MDAGLFVIVFSKIKMRLITAPSCKICSQGGKLDHHPASLSAVSYKISLRILTFWEPFLILNLSMHNPPLSLGLISVEFCGGIVCGSRVGVGTG